MEQSEQTSFCITLFFNDIVRHNCTVLSTSLPLTIEEATHLYEITNHTPVIRTGEIISETRGILSINSTYMYSLAVNYQLSESNYCKDKLIGLSTITTGIHISRNVIRPEISAKCKPPRMIVSSRTDIVFHIYTWMRVTP